MAGFIEQHDLWTEDQKRRAKGLARRATKDGLKLFRLAWADPHGAVRAKTVTLPALLGALQDGYNTNVATSTLDASGARVFSSFIRGGGMGLEEMTGSPSIVIVPDPTTFRVLPWEPEIGWVLCDEYFTSGQPFPFSPRHLLRQQLARLAERRMDCIVGLEVEWYLRRIVDQLSDDHIGAPGVKGRALQTAPVEPGYSFHSETNLDLVQEVVNALADAFQKSSLPIRSFEKEWGPGQMECTFAPTSALQAADDLVFFRAATRQVCRRLGYLASFMCRPRLKGVYSSGWHLHQSLIDRRSGRNLFTPKAKGDHLSTLGKHYLGGLMKNALAATIFANPTVNAYRRFRQNSLAPDRIAWGSDHRGTMLRVLSRGVADPASRIENRIGEPSANPYLYVASQVISGLDGIDHKRDPGPPDTDPYATQHPMLPGSLGAALHLMEESTLFARQIGMTFRDYYLRLKRTELGRYESSVQQQSLDPASPEITEWEHNEYFDFF